MLWVQSRRDSGGSPRLRPTASSAVAGSAAALWFCRCRLVWQGRWESCVHTGTELRAADAWNTVREITARWDCWWFGLFCTPSTYGGKTRSLFCSATSLGCCGGLGVISLVTLGAVWATPQMVLLMCRASTRAPQHFYLTSLLLEGFMLIFWIVSWKTRADLSLTNTRVEQTQLTLGPHVHQVLTSGDLRSASARNRGLSSCLLHQSLRETLDSLHQWRRTTRK